MTKSKKNDSLMKDAKEFFEMTWPLLEKILQNAGIYPENPVEKPDAPLSNPDSTVTEPQKPVKKLTPKQLQLITRILLRRLERKGILPLKSKLH